MDDEAPTRLRLRQLLAAHSDIEVAGEADSGTQAMELTGQLRPDVILLDIQLPGCSGIDVAACLPQPRPHIVFCTAYDQYAVEAFELHAVDYLLKPVGRARLADALERIRALPATSREAGSTGHCAHGAPRRHAFWSAAPATTWWSPNRRCSISTRRAASRV